MSTEKVPMWMQKRIVWNCPICGKGPFNTFAQRTHYWRAHTEEGRKFEPMPVGTHTAWNKGLTKKDNKSIAEASQKIYKHSLYRDLVDDDGKVYRRWMIKRVNAKKYGVGCELTLEEYCKLIHDAGLHSSDLGYKGNNYDLARYNDKGPYKVGNCRFITHKENMDEMASHRYIHRKFTTCKKCGKRIYSINKSGLCKDCAKNLGVWKKVTERPSRDVLKSEVRKYNNMMKLGKKYGVCDNAIRSWLKSYNLPYKISVISRMSDSEWEKI